ncbi:hypothetical protein JCM16303_005007 [Sporobolomyces ruberrimus]
MSEAIPDGVDPFALLGALRADLKASLIYVVVWMSIVVFDYLATLPLEIRYIWPSKLSPLKVIFLSLRYWTIINQVISTTLIMSYIPTHVCAHAYRFETAGAVILMSLSSSILGLRVYSIFERSLRIGCFLGAFLVVEICWMIFTATLLGPLTLPPFVSDLLGFHGCIAVGGAGLKTYVSSAFWAAPLLFDATILTLTIYKIITTERHAGGKVPILQRILKSSILYFVPIACMHLVTVAMAAFTRATLKSFNPPASLAFTGIAATRLVLSLFDSSNSISNQATGSGIFFWKSKQARMRSKRRSPNSIRIPPLGPLPNSPRQPRQYRPDEFDRRGEIEINVERHVETRSSREEALLPPSRSSKRSGNTLEIVPRQEPPSTPPPPRNVHIYASSPPINQEGTVRSVGFASSCPNVTTTYPPSPITPRPPTSRRYS